MFLQLLAIGQPGQEVVLRHATQAALGLVTQVGVALDRFEQLVGGIDPQPQFIAFMAFELGDLVFAGPVRVDRRQVLDDPRQRLGQQPVVDQVQHQAHRQGPKHSGDKDNHRADNKILAVRGGVEGDAQVAVVLAVGTFARPMPW